MYCRKDIYDPDVPLYTAVVTAVQSGETSLSLYNGTVTMKSAKLELSYQVGVHPSHLES